MGRLTAIVLGAAAGGGFPQWNCRCQVCRLAWAGDVRVRARTQASLAVTGDGENWVLINASPDLPAQLRQSKGLHPQAGIRGSPIKAVLLTGAEIDQITGLLSLREREPFTVCATAATLMSLADNAMFGVLAEGVVTRRAASPGKALALPGGLTAELFLVPGKVPLYLEGATPETAIETASETAANVGVEISAGGARIAYVPGAAAVTPAVLARLGRADAIFFDGTLFRDDEMIASGTGTKTGRRMGHMPIAGADGSLTALAAIAGRRIYVHINNTNPILVDGSPERGEVERGGWEIAWDGMEIVL
jgi:pyrroloquinoline quinone biosynthesis protein B